MASVLDYVPGWCVRHVCDKRRVAGEVCVWMFVDCQASYQDSYGKARQS